MALDQQYQITPKASTGMTQVGWNSNQTTNINIINNHTIPEYLFANAGGSARRNAAAAALAQEQAVTNHLKDIYMGQTSANTSHRGAQEARKPGPK